MPNWCFNYITVKNPEVFKEKCMKNGEFRLANVVPVPEHIQYYEHLGVSAIQKDIVKRAEDGELTITGDNVPNEVFIHGLLDYIYTLPFMKEAEEKTQVQRNDWYNWNCENFGTKWDIEPVAYNPKWLEEMIKNKESIDVDFETAWSPPMPVLEKMAKLGVDFEWHCTEESDAYAMRGYTTSDGEFIYEDVDPSEYSDGWTDDDDEE